MTIAQRNTAGFGADYRLAPLKARNESYHDVPGNPLVRMDRLYGLVKVTVGRSVRVMPSTVTTSWPVPGPVAAMSSV